MAKTRDIFQSRLVYNRTGRAVTCYNNEGNFVELEPNTDEPIPDFEFGIIYVVSQSEYEKLKKSGRTTKDLARICRQERGRANVSVVYLESYDLREMNEPIKIIPCSVASYVRNDPDENVHHVLDA